MKRIIDEDKLRADMIETAKKLMKYGSKQCADDRDLGFHCVRRMNHGGPCIPKSPPNRSENMKYDVGDVVVAKVNGETKIGVITGACGEEFNFKSEFVDTWTSKILTSSRFRKDGQKDFIQSFNVKKIINPPNCPLCKNTMALRKNRKTGKYFWGCGIFPRCSYSKELWQVDNLNMNKTKEINVIAGKYYIIRKPLKTEYNTNGIAVSWTQDMDKHDLWVAKCTSTQGYGARKLAFFSDMDPHGYAFVGDWLEGPFNSKEEAERARGPLPVFATPEHTSVVLKETTNDFHVQDSTTGVVEMVRKGVISEDIDQLEVSVEESKALINDLRKMVNELQNELHRLKTDVRTLEDATVEKDVTNTSPTMKSANDIDGIFREYHKRRQDEKDLQARFEKEFGKPKSAKWGRKWLIVPAVIAAVTAASVYSDVLISLIY